MGKSIELCVLKAGDLKSGFGNPRKISKAKLEELCRSIETFGNFGTFVVDEENNLIAGNQRHKAIMRLYGPDFDVECKRLHGYTEAELRAINIKDNTHSGIWDLDLLADWTADLTIDLGLDIQEKNPDERKIRDMDLIRYEKYDYVMIVCRNEVDYLNLTRSLGIDKSRVLVAKRRRIKARAIWYDDMKAQIIPKKEIKTEEKGEKND